MYIFTLPAEQYDETNLSKQVIRHLILKHRSFAPDLREKKQYYKGDHKILKENRKNKLVCNHAKDIADTATSYFLGNQIAYKSDQDITVLTDALELADADETDGDNGLDMSVYGRAYEYVYPAEGETNLRTKNLPPERTFMVYDDTIE